MRTKKICQLFFVLSLFLLPELSYALDNYYFSSSGSGSLYENNIAMGTGDKVQIWGGNVNVGLCNGCTRSVSIKYSWASGGGTTTLVANQTTQLSGGNDEMPVDAFGMITATANDTLQIQLDVSGGTSKLMGQVLRVPSGGGGTTQPTMTELIFQYTIIFFLVAGSIIWIIRKLS